MGKFSWAVTVSVASYCFGGHVVTGGQLLFQWPVTVLVTSYCFGGQLTFCLPVTVSVVLYVLLIIVCISYLILLFL